MLGKARIRLVSGMALLLAIVCVMAQGKLRGDISNNPRYMGTALIAAFTFLFLSAKNEDQSE
jgi:hypothetical protein